jgi:hypothetical protein
MAGHPPVQPVHLFGNLEILVQQAEYKSRGISFLRGFGNDPYCRVRVGTTIFKTKIYKGPDKGSKSSWYEKFNFNLTGPISVQFEIMDADELTPDSIIGLAKVSLDSANVPNGQPQWITLTKVDGSTPVGRIEVCFITVYIHLQLFSQLDT